MRTTVLTAPRLAAVALAMTIALAVPRTASALAIIHTGVGTGGIVTTASNSINVALLDIRSGLVQNPDVEQLCDESGADACLLKVWTAGTQNDPHLMQVAPDGPGIVIAELVFNTTGVAWTDYHVEVANADIASVEASLFSLDSMGAVDEIMGGVTTLATGDVVSFFFDTPLASLDPMAESAILLGFLLELESADDTVLIGQIPSLAVPEPATLAILGLGLAGLGLVRRRRSIAV